MNDGEKRYIWQANDWPRWRYDLAALTSPLTEVSLAQGLLLGRLADVGMALRDQASLAALTEDVVKTSEIEGEVLPLAAQRLRFLIDFAFATGLRASELVGARLGMIKEDDHGDHWLHLVGKGEKLGKVALPSMARAGRVRIFV